MQSDIAFPISIYAAVEADAAREAAELAETRAFMAGYSHATATPQERQRYVESVKVLYPPPAEKKQMDAVTQRCIGGAIVLLFFLIVGGGVASWWKDGDFERGAYTGFAVLWVGFVVFFLVGLFCLGVGLLFS